MNREIKFRAWDKDCCRFERFEMGENDDCYGMFRVAANKFGSVVEQYTGLKDKNGKEIYEGDILLIPVRKDKPKGNLYTVIWHKVHARFNFANKNGEFGEIQIGKIKRAEVIGNIHETPELLGGEE